MGASESDTERILNDGAFYTVTTGHDIRSSISKSLNGVDESRRLCSKSLAQKSSTRAADAILLRLHRGA